MTPTEVQKRKTCPIILIIERCFCMTNSSTMRSDSPALSHQFPPWMVHGPDFHGLEHRTCRTPLVGVPGLCLIRQESVKSSRRSLESLKLCINMSFLRIVVANLTEVTCTLEGLRGLLEGVYLRTLPPYSQNLETV